MVADINWALAPGLFSVWGGSINQFANGNIEFDVNAPALPPNPNVASEIQEVTQTSTPEVVWKMDISPIPMYAYRAYRVPSLYPRRHLAILTLSLKRYALMWQLARPRFSRYCWW